MARVALHAVDPSQRLALVRAFETAPATWDVFLWRAGRQFDVRVTDAPESDSDILFEPADPDRAVGAVAQALARGNRRTIVVTGARRGCGVTTFALHFAAAAALQRDVVLVDLDPSSSLRARLGLPDDARHWGEQTASAGLPHSAGFHLFLAPPDGAGEPSLVLGAAGARADHVIVDAPEERWRDAALDACTSAILVVPPSRQGIAHARKVLASRADVHWSCVVNRLGQGGELTARHVARALEQPVSIDLPCSPYLRDREDDHRLLNERWSRYFRRVARVSVAVL
jgi:hypothetical protein